jgi:hypothetical protein
MGRISSPYDGRSLSNYRTAVKRVREVSMVYFTLQDRRGLAATAMERGRACPCTRSRRSSITCPAAT